MFYTSSFLQVTHGFFTRQGGVSHPPFHSLNLALKPGESFQNVKENRRIVLEKLGVPHKTLVTLNQVHSAHVVVVDKPWSFLSDDVPAADAMITRNSEVVLGVFTADCVPILLYDPISKTIAAVHAGWRGLVEGVIEETIKQMENLGCEVSHICAAIGPCIHKESYEVGVDVFSIFAERGLLQYPGFSSLSSSLNIPSPEDAHTQKKTYYLDLPYVAASILKIKGIVTIDVSPHNTYADSVSFFSCRRAFHNNEPGFGCQISAITLP